jgi:hypothetical protein
MKVTRSPIEPVGVTIERMREHLHTHNIEESFRVKKPMMLKRVIEQERVLHAVHNVLAAGR